MSTGGKGAGSLCMPLNTESRTTSPCLFSEDNHTSAWLHRPGSFQTENQS